MKGHEKARSAGLKGVSPVGARCRACGRAHFPPRARCIWCWSTDLVQLLIASRGQIETLTVVHRAPPGRSVPYGLAWARFEDEGLRLFARVRLVKDGSLKRGSVVELVIDDDNSLVLKPATEGS